MIKLCVFYLLTALYYNSYRYIFQINNARTSPTYSDTPAWLSGGKYAIIFSLFFLMCIYVLTKVKTYSIHRSSLVNGHDGDKFGSVLVIIFSFVVFYSLFITLISRDLYAFEAFCFFCILPLMLLGSYDKTKLLYYFYRTIRMSAWIFLFVDIIQYVMFFVFNRLPALAYEGSVSVRFGSLQDDPNGYAFLMSLFFFIGISYNGMKKWFFYFLYLVNLVLTISFTGIAAVFFSVFIVYMLISKINTGKLFLLWSGSIFFVISSVIVSQLPLVQKVILTKQGSIEQHASLFTSLSNITLLDFLGFNPVGWVAESSYMNMLFNFGIIVCFIVYIFILKIIIDYSRVIIKCRKKYSQLKYEPIYILGVCCLTLSIAVVIGGINLPLEVVFPVNALFPLCLAILYITKNIYKKCYL